MNDGIILQSANSKDGGVYYPHLAVSVALHADYALANRFDYRAEFGDISEFGSNTVGGYSKLDMILDVINKYKFIVWVDCDALIVNKSVNLRSAFGYSHCIGAVRYDKPISHVNVGVLFIKSCELSKRFIIDMRDRPAVNNWYEQHHFNQMIDEEQYQGVFKELDKKYNYWIYDDTPCDNVVIRGYHGGATKNDKLMAMEKETLMLAGKQNG